jgi:predicted cobalt transporter CbtA
MSRRTQIFPFVLCALSLCASFMYAIEPGKWRNAVYWGAAAVIAFVLAE